MIKGAFFIRAIGPADEALLVAGFARLSDRSRRLRFLGLRNSLSAAELHTLTHVDHGDTEALLALSEHDGRGIGIAQYVRASDNRHSAEIAITVIDDWQRHGVGTELLTRLVERAAEEGIDRLTALVADDNAGAINLLRRFDPAVAVIDHDGVATEYEIMIAASSYRDSRDLALACS
jgi:RimJ/RimL family protein N-acetyltransferase